MSRTGIYDLHDGFIPDDDCEQEEPKMTNADRIRSLSDEELATWIDRIQADAYERGMMETPIVDYPNIYSEWLNWLKEKAEE